MITFWLVADAIGFFVSGVVSTLVCIVLSARIRAWRIVSNLQKEADIEWMRKNVLRRKGEESE